ncbi:major facilitator superfamily-domain-containing protein [Penicillium macrosclerotiorum]|uniref:major facilitator superfamily-domain-containing protein n=1 Tax=Penicillium macrosclerotiorum TaxID=303699 RepID=UPI0025484D7F|nr:major facilitator superfamily-domain-containing protein [Penicillium macrosclerotiorum]KAJ5676016.1 major facilitator superfamily-domain-containing protein [Penicillium macrosclerotiorum]
MVEHPPVLSKYAEAATVSILCLSHLLMQAALGQVIAPLLIISQEFGATDVADSSWYVAAYSLTVGTFILIAGRFGDAYGHRLMILIGYVWFGIWSLVAGFSVYSGEVLFIIARAFQGIGPAILLPNSLAILAHLFPPGLRKNVAFSLFAAAAPNGYLLGCLFSSIFAQLVWWPWAFWVLGIVCFAVALLVLVIIPPQLPDKESRPGLDQLDLLGVFTGVIGLVLVNFAWNQGAVVGWSTPYTYSLLIVGLAFLFLFAWLETRSLHPVVPTQTLNVDTIFVLTCIACGWSSFGIWLFYAWQMSERILGYTPLTVVAHFTPVGISGVLAAFSVAYLIGRLGPYCIMPMSMASFLLGSILFATAPRHQTYWAQAFVSIIVMPWGMDLSYPSATILLSNATPHSHQGIAASLMNTVVNYSISIGLGIAATVESNISSDGKDIFRGIRGAQYVSVGLAGMGLLVSLAYVFVSMTRGKSRNPDVQMDDSTSDSLEP